MNDVKFGFIHRNIKPTGRVEPGYFYWIENEGEPEIYFSPGSNPDDMILLNEKIKAEDLQELVELKSRMESAESRIGEIESRMSTLKDEILGEIDLREYLTEDDLEGYAKKDEIPVKVSDLENDAGYLTESEIPDMELDDSDFEMITEKVTKEKLTWKVI